MQTLKHGMGILKDLNAKKHIIIREICDQQTHLSKHNMRNNILFHNILEDPMEDVRLRQNSDCLYDDPITTRLIIKNFLIEVIGIDLMAVHDMLLESPQIG